MVYWGHGAGLVNPHKQDCKAKLHDVISFVPQKNFPLEWIVNPVL